jgi:lipid-A-disaccharide synthase
MRQEKPEAVVMIDYPGFNWWIARAAKRNGIPVFYYGVPQMWAWASWRIHKMRRLVDHVLCKLPFEKDWYEQRGCHATFVGHPYFDELSSRRVDEQFAATLRDRPLVTLLPGSRRLEVENNWPMLKKAAEIIHEQRPDSRLAVGCFNDRYAEMVRADLQNSTHAADIEVYVGRTPELIQEATVCLACSGSVSLELLYHRTPSAIVYRGPKWRLAMVRRFVLQVRYITLVNLLGTDDGFTGRATPFDPDHPDASRVPMPEYLTSGDCSPQLARHALEWLNDEQAHADKVAQLGKIRDEVAAQGASKTAAAYILQTLDGATESRRAA